MHYFCVNLETAARAGPPSQDEGMQCSLKEGMETDRGMGGGEYYQEGGAGATSLAMTRAVHRQDWRAGGEGQGGRQRWQLDSMPLNSIDPIRCHARQPACGCCR